MKTGAQVNPVIEPLLTSRVYELTVGHAPAQIAGRRPQHIPDIVARLQSMGRHQEAETAHRTGDTAWLTVPLLHGAEGLGLLHLVR